MGMGMGMGMGILSRAHGMGMIAQGWELRARLPLPCWGDTVEDLTVWTRRPSPLPAPPARHPVLACDACATPLGTGEGAAALRRCRYCRLACFCSAACERAGREAHLQYHAAKLIAVRRQLDFNGRDYHRVEYCP